MARRDFDGFAEDFREWMTSRNFSALTVRRRSYDLQYFFEWARDRGVKAPMDVTRPMVEQYRRWLSTQLKADGRPLSFSTQTLRLTALKSFFKWLAKENHVLYNPAAELDMPRRSKRLPRAVLSLDEVARVLAAPDTDTATGLRDRAIIEVLYSTGMRRSEASMLRCLDVDHHRGTVTIHEGKGRADRLVPIGDGAMLWVQRYQFEGRPRFVVEPDEGWLFLAQTGKRLKATTLGEMVKRTMLAAGIEKDGACHLFRHTMATQMLENGADIRFIQEMLGHAELSSTQIYTRVSIRKLKEVHEKTLRKVDVE